jgi:hypothetical protein
VKRVILIIGIALIVVLLGFTLINNNSSNSDKKESAKEAKRVDSIEKYGYHLYDNQSSYYKDKFQELSKCLNKEEVDEEEYAKLLSELFVIDLFDLNSKVSNTDVGGRELFYKDTRDAFVKTMEDNMYKGIESNVYGNRKQELPVVTGAVATVEKTAYTGKVTNDENAYKATVDITYKKDLEYPTKVYLTLVHSEDKLFIINIK